MSSAQEAMENLTAQWYNAVTAGCGLDPNTFQLIQGNQALGTTSQALWTLFDAVPPLSVTHLFNPSEFNSFSSDYGAVLLNLIQPNSDQFQKAMGVYYADWVAYLKAYPSSGKPMPAGGIPAILKDWASFNMPPGQAQSAYTSYIQLNNGVVPTALTMYYVNAGGAETLKAYNTTLSDVHSALQGAPSMTVRMDSATAKRDTSHTWAQGEVSGAYDIFSGSASGSYDHLTTSLYEAGLTFEAKFDHLTVIQAGPLSQGSITSDATTYPAWYSSAALHLAYTNDNPTVWQSTPPTWGDTFGPNGDLLRLCAGIVVVDGITLNITSNVSYSESDQESFQVAAKVGFFPFFSASGSGGWSSEHSFDDKGNLSMTVSSAPGNPQVLGVMVVPIAQALGGSLK